VLGLELITKLFATKVGVTTKVVEIRESEVKVRVTGADTLFAKPKPVKSATPPTDVMV
jgi:hypothetical protein